jgi:hypothetical protein
MIFVLVNNYLFIVLSLEMYSVRGLFRFLHILNTSALPGASILAKKNFFSN